MRKQITTIILTCLICNNLHASNVQIEGDLKSKGDTYITGKGNINITKIYIQGVKPEDYLQLAREFDITETAVKNFFKIIEQKQVPIENLDARFRQIATRHKELQSRLKQFNLLVDPDIQQLRNKAEEAINNGEYEKADKYFDEALERQMVCINNSEKQLINCKLSAAEMKVDKGDIQLILFNKRSATILFKEAVKLLPRGHELLKAEYLQKLAKSAFYPESQTALEQCLAIREKLLPKDDIKIAESLKNLANLYSVQGKFKEAIPLLQRSLDIAEKSLGRDHFSHTDTLFSLAYLHKHLGKYEDAENFYKRQLEIRASNNADSTLNNLASLYDFLGKKVEAEHLYKMSLERIASNNDDPVPTLNRLADMYKSQVKYEKAEPLYKRSLEITEKTFGKDHSSLDSTLNNFVLLDPLNRLADLYKSQGKYYKAEPLCKRKLEITEKISGKDHPSVALCLQDLANLYFFQGKYEEAEPLYQRSIGILENASGKNLPNINVTFMLSFSFILEDLANLYYTQCKYEEAEHLYQRSLGILEKGFDKDSTIIATTLKNLANLYYTQCKYEAAEPLYQRILGIYEKKLGKNHPAYKTVMENYSQILSEKLKN